MHAYLFLSLISRNLGDTCVVLRRRRPRTCILQQQQLAQNRIMRWDEIVLGDRIWQRSVWIPYMFVRAPAVLLRRTVVAPHAIDRDLHAAGGAQAAWARVP